jgi:hypothetical protein
MTIHRLAQNLSVGGDLPWKFWPGGRNSGVHLRWKFWPGGGNSILGVEFLAWGQNFCPPEIFTSENSGKKFWPFTAGCTTAWRKGLSENSQGQKFWIPAPGNSGYSEFLAPPCKLHHSLLYRTWPNF